MLEAILLSALHVLAFGAMFATAISLGFLILPRMEWERACEFFWALLLRYGLGLCLVSACAVWLGLFGWINAWTVVPLVLLGALTGVWRAIRANAPRLPAFGESIRLVWKALLPHEKIVVSLVALWTALISLNLLIGGMVPDMNQDSMWYHLSVPGQWALTGRAFAWPTVMPSNYPLAMEAVYAGLLTVGDEVLCSVLYAQVTLALLWAMVVSGVLLLGWRGGLFVAASAMTFLCPTIAIVPIGAENNNAAAFLLFLAFVELMRRLETETRPLHQERAPEGHWRLRTVAVGFLLGTASAAKLVVLGYWVPMLFFYFAAVVWSRRGYRAAPREVAWLFAGVFLAYVPWAIRGWTSNGNPFFPLAPRFFHVKQEYAAVLRVSQQNESLFPLTWEGIKEAFGANLQKKTVIAMTNLDIMFGMLAIAAVGVVWRRETLWRIQGLILLAMYPSFLLMKGNNQILRYFAICYPLAAPALARLLKDISDRLTPSWRTALLLVLFAGGASTYIRKQARIAAYDTFQWRFHPIVTESQRLAYAAHAETGPLALTFHNLQPFIGKDARVFLADCWYPYYLKRRCLWADEMIGSLSTVLWREKDARQIHAFLTANGFDYVLLTNDSVDWRLDELERSGQIHAVSLPAAIPPDWRLLSVK